MSLSPARRAQSASRGKSKNSPTPKLLSLRRLKTGTATPGGARQFGGGGGGTGGTGGTGGGGFGGGFARASTASHTVAVHLAASVSGNVILLAVVLAIAGGLIAGIFGGWRAARLRPADALSKVA